MTSSNFALIRCVSALYWCVVYLGTLIECPLVVLEAFFVTLRVMRLVKR